jgi:hypothetical protein
VTHSGSPADLSAAHLRAHLGLLETRVRGLAERVGSRRPARTAALAGLFLTLDDVRAEAAPADEPPEDAVEVEEARTAVAVVEGRAQADGHRLRLVDLARAFHLAPIDVELLLIAIAPDVDGRFERYYGYLHDDLTRRRASVALAVRLAGGVPLVTGGRLATDAPLRRLGLLDVVDPDRPLQGRGLRVPDRIVDHLLGYGREDPAVRALLRPTVPCLSGDPDRLARALRSGAAFVYVREERGGDAVSLATAACRAAGLPALAVDLDQVRDPASQAVAALEREARLGSAAIVAGPVEALAGRAPHALRSLAELDWVVLLCGRQPWDPSWAQAIPLLVEAPAVHADRRGDLWRARLNGTAVGFDPVAVTASFRLAPAQIDRAATSALLQARFDDRPLADDHVKAGARAQSATSLGRLADRVEPAARIADLVLPARPRELLGELLARARLREQVYVDWHLGSGGGRGTGVTALFAGQSGTGKTMAAEAVAHELGLDLYTVDLSTVVDKYIGETEKNMDRIFDAAEQANGVLFFDEADALFGKRSEVRDAHDRYANIAVAYLLQRMESFDGVAVLATNLRGNLDEAFDRRLDVVIDFPVPDAECRLRLWDRCLGDHVPRSADLDLAFCAEAFELTGGNIRNVVVAAAFAAADAGRAVSMEDLVRATEREYRKLGRLCRASEFGPCLQAVTS